MEIAWAAGLFEGEGSFTIGEKHARMRLAMTDEDVVRRFHEIVGVGYVQYGEPAQENYLPQWTWFAGAKLDMEHVIGLVLPFLGRRKTQQAARVIEMYKTKKPRPARRESA